jgi:hypothetical protein
LEYGYVVPLLFLVYIRGNGVVWEEKVHVNGVDGANDATEMFLPSYVDYHFDDLERRQDPVQDIILTDEEVKNMFPQ